MPPCKKVLDFYLFICSRIFDMISQPVILCWKSAFSFHFHLIFAEWCLKPCVKPRCQIGDMTQMCCFCSKHHRDAGYISCQNRQKYGPSQNMVELTLSLPASMLRTQHHQAGQHIMKGVNKTVPGFSSTSAGGLIYISHTATCWPSPWIPLCHII